MDKKPLYILCLAILPLMICSGMVYSVLALYISEELGASRTHIGLIFMTGSLAGAIIAPFFGKLSDKVGRRPILIAAMAGFTLVFLLYALIRDTVQAYPVQAVEGVVWAGLGPVIMAYIADIVPPEMRGWAMGVYERTWMMGWVLGPSLGGVLSDTIGFRVTFVIGGTLVILGLAAVWLYVKEPQRD